MELYSILVDFSPTFYCLHKPLLFLYGSFDGTIIDIIISTILLTMYYKTVFFMFCYDWWLCMAINISVQYDGRFLPDIILLAPRLLPLGSPVKYHVVALYLQPIIM